MFYFQGNVIVFKIYSIYTSSSTLVNALRFEFEGNYLLLALPMVTNYMYRVSCFICLTLYSRHGRKHNIMPSNVNFRANIWALKDAGCTHVLASNACGGLQEYTRPGDLVVLDDFFDRTHKRQQTFYDGEPGHPEGVVHLPGTNVYCQRTREVVQVLYCIKSLSNYICITFFSQITRLILRSRYSGGEMYSIINQQLFFLHTHS